MLITDVRMKIFLLKFDPSIFIVELVCNFIVINELPTERKKGLNLNYFGPKMGHLKPMPGYNIIGVWDGG